MKYKKKYLYSLIFIFLLLLVIFLALFAKNKSKKTTDLIQPTEVKIPTIDNTVKIDLISLLSGKEVLLKIDNIPQTTETIDYELSYQTKNQGFQGIIGTIDVENKKNFQKKLTLGTCSSGTCVYHQLVGKIKLNLKFNGSYGEKIFEKEY